MDKIISFKDMFPRSTVVAFTRIIGARFGLAIEEPEAHPENYLHAEINAADMGPRGTHGRWIVNCPSCHGAEFVDPDQPVFMCCSCFNLSNKGKWYHVIFPDDKDAIESTLLKRDGINRNWKPPETLADLEAENRKAGIKA